VTTQANGAAIRERVRQYYGSTLASSADLRTSACCDASVGEGGCC
jgi:hypothetical protein